MQAEEYVTILKRMLVICNYRRYSHLVGGLTVRKNRLLAVIFVTVFATIVLLSQLNAFASSSEDDWPMFRHDPAHTGATTSSAPMKPVKLWSYAEGHFDVSFIGSSAAVVNGTVYVGSNYNQVEQQGGNIRALDAYTGAKI